MPSIRVQVEAPCRVAPEEAGAWVERQPAERRNPGPGEARVEILERTDSACVYRISKGALSETTRRVRIAPNAWTFERTTNLPGAGRFRVAQSLTVILQGDGSRLVQVIDAIPLNRTARFTAWIGRKRQPALTKGASRALSEMSLEIEAASGFAVDTGSVFGPSTAVDRWWSRRAESGSSYSPSPDWSVGLTLSGSIAGGLGVLALIVWVSDIASRDQSATAAAYSGGFLLFAALTFSGVWLMNARRTIDRVEALPSGIVLHRRGGPMMELPWSQIGLSGMRMTRDQYLVWFRHPGLGSNCQLRLSRDDAAELLKSPYFPVTKPGPLVLASLGLGPTLREHGPEST